MSRPAVLLLHAFPLDSRMWDPHQAALEEAGYHAIAPDLPGGDSANTLAAWAERVLHAADGPLVPVGVSMGGYLAFELWRQAPERIAALVLVGTRAGAGPQESRAGRDDAIRVVCDDGPPALWERLEGRLFAPGAPPDVVAHAREIALEQGTLRLKAALEAIRDREDSRETLATIDVPVLVVVGEGDTLIPPEESEAMAAELPNARLVRIPGAGHLPPLEQPGRFDEALLSFLAEVAS